MKMGKMLFFGFLLSFLGAGSAQAAAPGTVPRTVLVAGEPGFDIINKSGGPITILVNNGYKNIKKTVVRPASTILGKTLSANNESVNIDPNEPTLLVVYEGAFTNPIEPFRARGGDEGTQKFFFDWMISGPKAKNYMYHFTPGKKVYVTLHKAGNLNPQTGPKGGKTGKTEAGYSLGGNVSQGDIIKFDEKYSDYVQRRPTSEPLQEKVFGMPARTPLQEKALGER